MGAVEIIIFEILPWMITVAWLTYVVVKVKLKIKKNDLEARIDDDLKEYVNVMACYPIILAVCWIPV